MKRMIPMLVAIILLLQMGCSRTREVTEEEMTQPVRFYYCASGDEDYDRDTGALGWELRDLGEKTLTKMEVLERYLQGPVSGHLCSMFPAGVTVEQIGLREGVLTVTLSEEMEQVTGVRQTLAAACLLYTMTQFEDVDALRLECSGSVLQGNWSTLLTKSDFLLEDKTYAANQLVQLYFANAGCRYLASEGRERTNLTEQELPAYVVEQLLQGPQEAGRYAALPAKTELLGITVEEGLCTVNFSSAFLEDRPQTHREARMAVFSVVNTLTELPQIERVRFLCSGVPVSDYVGLALDQPLIREKAALDTSAQAGSYDATLFLPCEELDSLVAVPTMVERTSEKSLCEDVLRALIAFEPANGYENPIPEDTKIQKLNLEDGLCSVTFNNAFAQCGSDPEQEEKAVRSIVCTLCRVRNVEQVRISIQNGGLTGVDLSEPLTAEESWYMH